MDANVVAVVAIIAVLLLAVALFVRHALGRQPSRTGPTSPLEDRPAGPEAESMSVHDRGEISPRPQQDEPPMDQQR